ncbi:MAG: PHP domain-containing protein [Clostridia bacterium]|nr:PHP domain-containing protein [Clostridia bacterium]
MKITQDLHMHTHLSSCAKPEATLEAYIRQAAELGLDTLGIADHLWDDKIPLGDEDYWRPFYSPQNLSHVLKAREEIKSVDAKGLRILFGAEAEYDPVRCDIALSDEAGEILDFVLIPNSHTHMMMPKSLYEPYQAHADFMVKATHEILKSARAKYITALAHPFDAVACPYDKSLLYPLISRSEYEDIFLEAKEKSIAIEINTSPFLNKTDEEIKRNPKWQFFAIAKECGCRFTFGSDCHHPASQRNILAARAIAEVLSLTDNDILVL